MTMRETKKNEFIARWDKTNLKSYISGVNKYNDIESNYNSLLLSQKVSLDPIDELALNNSFVNGSWNMKYSDGEPEITWNIATQIYGLYGKSPYENPNGDVGGGTGTGTGAGTVVKCNDCCPTCPTCETPKPNEKFIYAGGALLVGGLLGFLIKGK